MAKKVEGELYESLKRQLSELGRQLRQEDGYSFDPVMLQNYLQNAIDGKFHIVDVVGKTFTRLISRGEVITIDACDGSEILADADDIFAYIDPDLKNWDINQRGLATKETLVEVHEIVDNANFFQLFNSLSPDLRKICFTENQIVGFAKKHRNWLRTDGCGTFFLFESNDKIFVANVYIDFKDDLCVGVFPFEHSSVWDANDRRRLVAPQRA